MATADPPRVTMEPRGSPCNETKIEILEYAQCARLPVAYRAFLLAWNGGTPHPPGFLFEGRVGVVRCFYSIDAAVRLVDLHERRLALRGIVPAGHLAIAAIEGGDLLTLQLAQPCFGGVFYLSIAPRERFASLPPRLVATTFADFLSNLVEPARAKRHVG